VGDRRGEHRRDRHRRPRHRPKDSAFDAGAQDTAHRIANTTGLPYSDILARIERYLVVDLKVGIYLVILAASSGSSEDCSGSRGSRAATASPHHR
jgi:hypothetical protein